VSPRVLTRFQVSVYTSDRPLGKRITRVGDGSVKKESLGHIVHGTVETVTLESLQSFARLRAGLGVNQALGYGLTRYPKAQVITKRRVSTASPATDQGGAMPVVVRSSQHLFFAGAPGLLMVDHDPVPGAPSLGPDDLRKALCAAIPQLGSVTMLWAPSAGSLIYAGHDEVVGLRGSRCYFAVSDARRIPVIGNLLFDRLALLGYGRIAVSASGRMLRRGPIDAAVFQAERLDYVRASCGEGLEQRTGEWRIFPGEGIDQQHGTMLDVSSVMALTDDESRALEATWASLTRASAQESESARGAWAISRAHAQLARGGGEHDQAKVDEMVRRYEASAQSLFLERDHALSLADGREVSVDELLHDPNRFDGARMADPFEPEYGGHDRRIAVAYLKRNGGTDPAIYSHAHGGTWYSLRHPDEDFNDLGPELGSDGAAAGTSPSRIEDSGSASLAAANSSAAGASRRFTVQRAADFTAGPPSIWHIRGVLPAGELCVVYGASGSGKSFVVLDMACAIAAGDEWRGLAVNQGRVVYVVAEGRSGFRKRLEALRARGCIDLDTLPLGIVAECPRLLDGDEVELAAAIDAAGGASLVVIDTLAQAMAGGDENSAVDMGRALAACKLIHQATGATVLLVHHCGKEAAKGARGWSGLRAAADAELEVVRKADARTIRLTKQKDGDDSGAYPFALDVIDLGVDEDLCTITSCVVRHLDDVPVSFDDGGSPEPRGKWQRHLWYAMKELDGAVTRDALVRAAVAREPEPGEGKRDVRKQQVLRALGEMLAGGWFAEAGSQVLSNAG
jgi:hypothetical protein